MKNKICQFFFIFFIICNIAHANLSKENVYPVVILGGGVGALTSAIYLERGGIHTIVVEGKCPGGSISQSPLVQNWPGTLEISGQELVKQIKDQALANGATFLSQEVVSVDFSSSPYLITTRDLVEKEKIYQYKALTCIIALGAEANHLGISGEEEYWGRGVYNCVVCDGPLFKDKAVAVIGGGDSAIVEGLYLSNIAKQVYVIVRSKDFRGADLQKKQQLFEKPNVHVLFETSPLEITGDADSVTHLHLKDNLKGSDYNVEVDGVFLAIGSKPNSFLFKDQLDLDSQGYIVLKKDQETSKEGVFAIGDIVDPIYKQAISAAGDGAKAALQAERFLSYFPLNSFAKNASQFQTQTIANHSAIIELENSSDLKSMIQSHKISIVDFYSPWCGPCKNLHPVFEEKANQYGQKYQFIQVNVSKFSEYVSEYKIQGVPTLIVFKNGKIIERKVGLEEARSLLNNLNRLK